MHTTFTCDYCHHQFSQKRTLKIHMKIEHGTLIHYNEGMCWFTCPICCNKLYHQAQDLNHHVQKRHSSQTIYPHLNKVTRMEDVTYSCLVCKQPTLLSKRCSVHKKKTLSRKTEGKNTNTPLLTCWYCNQKFEAKSILCAHIQIEHGCVLFSNPDLVWYACHICRDRLYMRTQDIVKHLRNIHEELNVQIEDNVVKSLQDVCSSCVKCGTMCVLTKTCPKHKLKVKTGADEYLNSNVPSECGHHDASIDKCHSCQRCQFSSNECHQLWEHMFSEHKSKGNALLCNLCVNVRVPIKNATVLQRHMRHIHKKLVKLQITPRHDDLKEKCKILMDGSEMFKCPECGALLKNVWSLREHIMIHTGERPHICQICNKSFRNRGKLNVHGKRVHEQVRPHQCKYCGRTFSDSSNLTVHIRTHTDEKKYMCELCGAEFKQWASLYNHKFTHNNVKFKCTYCEKVYNNPSNLQRHMKSHTDDSLYICEVCGKDFGTSRYLKRHKDTHNTVNTFVCEVCNAGFKVKKHLTQHYKTHSIFIPPEQYNPCHRNVY
uniref:Zinc finger protein 85 n=1 Tax=Cacopsylla melanoneura TaxID=428564 RepID=A0A8D9F501_9HEMI